MSGEVISGQIFLKTRTENLEIKTVPFPRAAMCSGRFCSSPSTRVWVPRTITQRIVSPFFAKLQPAWATKGDKGWTANGNGPSSKSAEFANVSFLSPPSLHLLPCWQGWIPEEGEERRWLFCTLLHPCWQLATITATYYRVSNNGKIEKWTSYIFVKKSFFGTNIYAFLSCICSFAPCIFFLFPFSLSLLCPLIICNQLPPCTVV